jgi:hypothetical protein
MKRYIMDWCSFTNWNAMIIVNLLFALPLNVVQQHLAIPSIALATTRPVIDPLLN